MLSLTQAMSDSDYPEVKKQHTKKAKEVNEPGTFITVVEGKCDVIVVVVVRGGGGGGG